MRIKLIVMLAMAIFMPLGWVLALSDAAAPLVQSVGIYGCVAYATAIAFLCAWLIVGFIAELRKH